MYSLDIETDSLNPRRGKIIGFSYYDGIESIYVEHLRWNGETFDVINGIDTCKSILDSITKSKLILHNCAFDSQYIKNYFGIDILPSVYADTVLLSHILNENELSYGLKELSAKYLGTDSKAEQDELKKYLGKDKAFYKVPTHVLAKYAKKDVELTWNLYHLMEPQLTTPLRQLYFEEIMPLYSEVVIPMQARGVALDVAKVQAALESIVVDMAEVKSSIMRQIVPLLDKFHTDYYAKNYPLKSRGKVFDKMKQGLSLPEAQRAVAAEAGDEGFNLNSKQHLAALFFDILGETPLSYTDGGRPQVDADFLDHMAPKYAWAADLVLLNKLTKIKGTYLERFLEEQENGIFYPDYFLHRTVSGRMSGDMQQLPRPLESGHPLLIKYNNQIREFFIARPGYIICDDDYDSLEPRVFASVAGDRALTDIFVKGHDFYSTIAIMVEGLKDVSADKSAPNYLGKVNKSARQTAKAYSLGIAYGLDSYKLHKDLNILQADAERLIQGYFEAFPKLAEWMANTRKQMLTTGQVTTRFGRLRRQPEIPGLYAQHGDAVLNALDLWKKYNENSTVYKRAKADYKTVRHALNNAYNHQIQGLAGHILNRALLAIKREFVAKGIDAHIIGAVHDEIIVECQICAKDEVAEIVQQCMETTTIIETPLTAKPSFGYNFKEAK